MHLTAGEVEESAGDTDMPLQIHISSAKSSKKGEFQYSRTLFKIPHKMLLQNSIM